MLSPFGHCGPSLQRVHMSSCSSLSSCFFIGENKVITSSPTDELLYEKRGKVAYLTLNRTESMNALTPDMRSGIDIIAEDFATDPALLVLIITGAGNKAFCAGADLRKTIPQLTDQASKRGAFQKDPTRRFFSRIHKPIIAAINGFCLAGGTEMLQGTDIRIAADHATFGLPEPRWGLIPGGGSHVRLLRQIPYCHAMDILLTGRRITADEALRFALINKVVPADQLMAESERYAAMICRNGPLAVQAAKEAALTAYNMSWDEAFTVEALITARIFATDDAQEGPKAFAEKREPRFNGR
jgi:enoyl-CoA hydratase